MAYGGKRTTWTLRSIKEYLLSTYDVCLSTIHYALRQHALHLKRSAHRQRSPDPEYRKKVRNIEQCKAQVLKEADKFAMVAMDELSLHRLPTLARTYAARGSDPPKQGQGTTDCTRTIFGAVNYFTGQCHFRQTYNGAAQYLVCFLKQLLEEYPTRHLFLVMDNWPVHKGEKAQVFFQTHKERLTIVPLPTYAPFLNPQEKVWKTLRSHVSHNHPYTLMSEVLERFTQWSYYIEHSPSVILQLIKSFKEPIKCEQ